MKKFLKIAGISVLVLILIAAATPFLFKKKILELAKREINNNINATADFTNLSISLFRHFPSVSIKLENFYIVGKEQFEGDTLLSAPGLDASVNLISFFRGDNMKVNAIYLNQPMHESSAD